MVAKKADEEYSEEETARRRDEALRRALNTPPQPRKAKQDSGKAGKAQAALTAGKTRRAVTAVETVKPKAKKAKPIK